MIISKTPLRISLLGGGTDFPDFFKKYGGAVLSMAIDKYIYTIVNKRFYKDIVLNYSIKEQVTNVDALEHDLIKECLKKVNISDSIEITTLADIPTQGSGLGSSSAVTVGVLNALYAYKSKRVSLKRLFDEACEIEVEILGNPIGYQDQAITSHGNISYIEFRKDGSTVIKPLKITENLKKKLCTNLQLFYTNKTRKAETVLTEQKMNISEKTDDLKELSKLAFLGKKSILSGNIDEIGFFLNKSWELKKNLASGVTNPEIDDMYSKAIKEGALGAKIAGAGGGGFLLTYCKKANQRKLRSVFSNFRELPISFSREGSSIIFDY